MKQLFTLAILFFCVLSLHAQYVYEPWDQIPVKHNNTVLNYPFLGGINAVQFSEMDLNSDGIMDLLLMDRSGSRLSPFLNLGTPNQIDYQYAPSYIESFPAMRDWLITGDYNCDGKMDLFVGSSNIEVYENITGADKVLKFVVVEKIKSAYNKYEFGDTTRNTLNAGSVNKPALYDVGNDGDLDLLFFDQGGIKMEYHRNLSVEENGSCGLLYERRSKCWGDFTESAQTGTIFLDSCRFGDVPNPEGDARGTESTSKGAKHAGSTISAFDFYNRKATDLIVGDVSGVNLTALFNADSIPSNVNSHIYRKDTAFPSYDVPAYLPLFPAAYFIDLDNDSLKDMMVTTNSNSFGSFTKTRDNILFYKNIGQDTSQFELQSQENLFFEDMMDFGKGCNPRFFDYNRDGLMDLIIGNAGYLNNSVNSIETQLALYTNTGTTNDPLFELVDDNYLNLPSLQLDLQNNSPTQNAQLAFGDLDDDGDQDFVLGDHNGDLHFFEDTASGSSPTALFKLKTVSFERIKTLSFASPQLYDVNQNGLLDLIIGHTGGRLEYYENLGSKTEPIFTLQVTDIEWLNGDTIRYSLLGNPNLSPLEAGRQVDVNFAQNNLNNVFQTVARIDPNGQFIDLINIYRTDATEDEININAIIDYSVKKWGNVDIIAVDGNRDANPLIYEEEGELKLIVGSRYGNLYFYDSLSQHIDAGSFHLVDQDFLNLQEGDYVNLGGADLNNDNRMDLAIGNDAGGMIILKALYGVGIEEFESNQKQSFGFSVFPNPARNQFSIVFQEPAKVQIQLFDLQGKLLLEHQSQAQKTSISTSTLPNGVYLLKVNNQYGIESQKLIVQH